MNDPYLDTDWAQTSPEVSYILYLTDEEMKVAKKKSRDRANKILKLTPTQETRKTA